MLLTVCVNLSSGSFKAVFTANTILLFDIKMNREPVCSLIYCLFIWIWNENFTRCRNFSKCCFKVDMKLKLWYILVKRLLEQEKKCRAGLDFVNLGIDKIGLLLLSSEKRFCCKRERLFCYYVILIKN